jgi:hypothetical protein
LNLLFITLLNIFIIPKRPIYLCFSNSNNFTIRLNLKKSDFEHYNTLYCIINDSCCLNINLFLVTELWNVCGLIIILDQKLKKKKLIRNKYLF